MCHTAGYTKWDHKRNEDILHELHIEPVLDYIHQYQNRIRKREVDIEFYGISAMIDKNWKKANQEQRQVGTRFAIHGFHHKLCKNKEFHNPTADCECGFCEKKCERYHILNCENWTKTITEYSKE